ncbi:MAG: head GIN domain-containing protein [Saprospiraceae bacterium]|nr:head GIN domain-containing protein [Saprospiraceae bacterium]
MKTRILPSIACMLILAVVLTTTGCLEDRDAGPVSTETYAVTDFDKVRIASLGNVTLHDGTDFRVEIETHAEVHRDLEVEVVGNELEIRYNDNHNKLRIDRFEIDITAPLYTGVTLAGVASISGTDGISTSRLDVKTTGVGDITLRGIDVDVIDVDLDGVGDIELAGTASVAEMRMRDVGTIKSFDLMTDTCTARLSGVGDIRTYVSDLLDATLTGVGDIVYMGDPVLITDVRGQGSVRKK